MAEIVSLAQMVDLALGTPDVVNFNVLRSLLHALLSRLEVGAHTAEVSASDIREDDTRSIAADSGFSAVDRGRSAASDKVRNIETKVWKLEKIVDNLSMGHLPTNEELWDRAKSEGQRPVSDMWQSMQLSSKVNANEEGVRKLMSLVEDLMKEIDALKESNEELRKKLDESMKMNAIDDILQRLSELEQIAADLRAQFDLYPPAEAFNDFVTWSALEDSLKGLREKLEEDLAQSSAPVERVVIEMSSQTEIQSRPSTRPGSSRPSTRPSSARTTTPGPSSDLFEMLERLGKLTDRHDKLEDRVDIIEEELKKKLDRAALDGLDFGMPEEVKQQISNLTKQLEDLQKLLDMLKKGRDQDAEAIQRLQQSLSKLISEVDRLTKMSDEMKGDIENKQKLIDELMKLLEKLEETKADKDFVIAELEMKADKRLVDSKVNRTLFDSTVNDIIDKINELVSKMDAKDDEIKRQLEELSVEIDGKLDRLEFEPWKKNLERQLDALLKKLNALSQMQGDLDDDAAGIRKQLIQRFHCLSCDRPVEMGPNNPIPSVPPQNAMPATRTSRPYTTFELDQIRQHTKSTPMQDIVMASSSRAQYYDEAYETHFGRIRIRTDYDFLQGQTEVVDLYATARPCGGPHTLTHPHMKMTKVTQVNNLFREDEPPPTTILNREEADILGVDGHIYKGRLDKGTRFPDLQASPPATKAPKSGRRTTPKPPPGEKQDMRPISARSRGAASPRQPDPAIVPGMEDRMSSPTLRAPAPSEPDLQAEAIP